MNNQINNDIDRFKQIIMNFIGNSLKYTNQGFIYVTVQDFYKYSILIQIIDTRSVINKDK